MKVTVEPEPRPREPLARIANGAIFLGTINDYVSSGPFIKIGSISAAMWIVAKLENMGGPVWTSTRDGDATVRDLRVLKVAELVVREENGVAQGAAK